MQGQPSGTEEGSVKTSSLLILSGLSNHAVSGPSLGGAAVWTEGAASWCLHPKFPRTALMAWHSYRQEEQVHFGLLDQTY